MTSVQGCKKAKENWIEDLCKDLEDIERKNM